MFFDPRPKSKREELFGRDSELSKLHENADVPIIIITGVRRIGKTSLINVFLSEVSVPSVIIDLRSLRVNWDLKELYESLSRAFTSRLDKLVDVLRSISSIKIAGNEVEIRWRGRGALTLPSLFDELNKKRVIIALDEAQKLCGPRSAEVLEAIAHAYDYDKNVTFVLTGSEAGLLYGFLGIEDPKSPLYGRYCFTLSLERFSRDQSVEFLRLGFREAGLSIDLSVLEKATEVFDGIPGWLTFFGNEYLRGLKSLEKIRDLAINAALEELRNLVSERTDLLPALKDEGSRGEVWGYIPRLRWVQPRARS